LRYSFIYTEIVAEDRRRSAYARSRVASRGRCESLLALPSTGVSRGTDGGAVGRVVAGLCGRATENQIRQKLDGSILGCCPEDREYDDVIPNVLGNGQLAEARGNQPSDDEISARVSGSTRLEAIGGWLTPQVERGCTSSEEQSEKREYTEETHITGEEFPCV